MRSDYALYVVAIIFFAITGISYVVLVEFERNLSVVATAMLGLLFLGFGYTQRPTSKMAVEMPPPPPSLQTAIQVPQSEKAPIVAEIKHVETELTAVKGIKEKRKVQLKALGINNAEELANASAKDLARKLKISPKFTEEWIQNAKELTQK